MAKLVDAWDLKSPARKGVPVRFRLRAPSKIKGLQAKANANPCLFPVHYFRPFPRRAYCITTFAALRICGVAAPCSNQATALDSESRRPRASAAWSGPPIGHLLCRLPSTSIKFLPVRSPTNCRVACTASAPLYCPPTVPCHGDQRGP